MATERLKSLAIATESTFGTAQTTNWASGATRIPAEKIDFKPAQQMLERDGRADTFAIRQAPVLGAKGGTISFEVPVPGATTNAGGAVTTNSWFDKLMAAAGFTATSGTGTTVSGAGSTTTTVDCADASGIAVGSVVGVVISATIYARIVKSKSGNTITVTPALPSGPSNAAVVYSSASYFLTSTPGSLTMLLDIGGTEYVLTGCTAKPPMFEAKATERLMAKFEFQLDGWAEQSISGTATDAALPSVTTLKGLGQSFHFGTGATAMNTTEASIDPGATLVDQKAISGTNGRAAWVVTDAKPTGKATVYYASQAVTDHAAVTAQPFLVKIGTAAQAMVVYGGEQAVLKSVPGPANVNGILGQMLEVDFVEPSSSTNSYPIVVGLL